MHGDKEGLGQKSLWRGSRGQDRRKSRLGNVQRVDWESVR